MTKSEYAKHRQVSPAMVTHWLKSDRLVMRGNRVDVEASDAALAESLDPLRGGKNGKSDLDLREPGKRKQGRPKLARSASGELTREKAKRERVRGDIETLEYLERKNTLCEVSRVDRGTEAAFAALREAWLGQAARLHGRLAEESDPRKCYAILETDAETALAQLADKLANMKISRRSTRQ